MYIQIDMLKTNHTIRLVLANTEETTVTFQDGDKTFTLFCRTLTEAGETLINQNNQLQDDTSNGL